MRMVVLRFRLDVGVQSLSDAGGARTILDEVVRTGDADGAAFRELFAVVLGAAFNAFSGPFKAGC